MKKIYYQLLTIVCLLFMVTGVFAQPGVLDQSFGNNGKVYLPVTLGTLVNPVDVKVQPDQKILVLVRIDTGGLNSVTVSDNFFMYQLLRFKPDGTPDSSFALNGGTPVVNNERPTNIELLANGKILLNTALYSSTAGQYPPFIDLCLTRYNANGSIDNTFGTNGRAITKFDSTASVAVSVFVLPNGKIIQAGFSYVPSPPPSAVYNIMAGFDQNGNIDPSFGNNGKVKVRRNRFSNDYYALAGDREFTIPHSFLMQSNQKIVSTADSGLYRFNSNGSLDASFGANGFRYYPPAYYTYVPNVASGANETPAIAGLVEPNDKLVLVMRTTAFAPYIYFQSPLTIRRFNADGSPDSTFHTFVLDDDRRAYGSFGAQSGKIFLEPNGQYSLAAGVSYGGENVVSCIAKINSDGSADSSYGKRGRVNISKMLGNAAALQPDGKMLTGCVIDTFISGAGYLTKAWVLSRYEKNARVRYNTLVSDVFYDENANGVKDAGEEPFNGWYSINTVKPGIDTIRWYGQWPTYQADLHDIDTGTYSSLVKLYDKPYFTVVPVVKTTSHSTYWNTDTLTFAVQKIANIRDLAVTLIPLNNAKPGFPIDYLIKVHNAGTDSAGNVVLKLVKSNKIVYNSATVLPASVVADTITWNMGGLRSQHDAFIIVHGAVKTPPAVSLGDALQATATVSSDKPDTTTANDTSSYTHYVVSALDPNDKTEAHGGKIALSKAAAGEYLTYTIRFQNTGNDTAFNVYIRDTMDSKLDWNSLQIVASSHNYKMTMNDGKCLFTFPFIMLVDSVHNKALSHGYIVYKIKAKPNVQIGNVIKNTAAIYFDYNLPVMTNTESTTVVADALPLKLLSFTAKKQDKTNLLNWSTAKEVNLDRFEVERSYDSREFAKIGTVGSELGVGSIRNYSYTDNYPTATPTTKPQTTFYRLKMIDKDGQFTYSPVRMINNNSSFNINIYPNPAKDKLQLQIGCDKPITLQLQVLSLDGKVLLSNAFSAAEGASVSSINVSALPKGSYFMKAISLNSPLESREVKEESLVRFEKL